ncbi:hypothetical protein FKW77_009533 [Venturia effusa]|uniref:Uncharacterized protein n=1 Tax=Venturia effusa TaxID=50376 RepID=A0A517L640_9PEZI|nr:hypothetical protein FKW77_009533 [Venturia effusa]
MRSLKKPTFVPPVVQQNGGRVYLSYNMLIVGTQGAGKYCLHHQFVYACFPSIRDPYFDSETPQMLWKSESTDKYAFHIQPTRMDITRPESVPSSQHLYPATRLPADVYRFTDANGMMLVFSIDSRSSFDALTQLIDARKEDLKSKQVEPKVLCLVGNKLDKSGDKRKILCLEGEELAAKLGCPYVECSAKDQKGLEKLKSALIKVMETQGLLLQYEQQQRGLATQGSRAYHQKIPLMRRLTGGSLKRADTLRLRHSDEALSSRQTMRNQRERKGILITPSASGRRKGSPLSSENRIDEVDEETEPDEESQSSSQRSSNSSMRASSKQSSITSTQPSSGLSAQPSYGQCLTMERLPPAVVVSLSPVSQKPMEILLSPSSGASHTPAEPHQKAAEDLPTTTLPDVSNRGSPFQPQSTPEGGGECDVEPARSYELSQLSPRSVSPQYMFNTQSTSHSRGQSPEFGIDGHMTVHYDITQAASPSQLRGMISPPPMSPTIDEKRKLEEERAKLEEAKEKLRQEIQELQEHRARLEERRRDDAERRQIEEERKKIIEERKQIEAERQNLKEARRKIEEEEAQWECKQSVCSEIPEIPEIEEADHTPTMDENFEGVFPGIASQNDARVVAERRHRRHQSLQDGTKLEVKGRHHQEQMLHDDTKLEGKRRRHQEWFQQERQQDLQLRSPESSQAYLYSEPRGYFRVESPTAISENHDHLLRSVASPPPIPQRRYPLLQKRASLRLTRDPPQPGSSSDKTKSISSPPLSPDISQTLRRLLGKKEPKKPPSNDPHESVMVTRDHFGISTHQRRETDPSPLRPARSLLLPPISRFRDTDSREDSTRVDRAAAGGMPRRTRPTRSMVTPYIYDIGSIS